VPDPISEELIDDILFAVTQETAIELVTAANKLQMELDGFIRSQGLRLSPGGLRALIFGGDSSVAQGAIGTFRKAVEKALTGSVGRAYAEAMDREVTRLVPKGKKLRWVTESAEPCPDCVARSQYEPRTNDEWADIGKPKTGATICGSNCLCTLRPV